MSEPITPQEARDRAMAFMHEREEALRAERQKEFEAMECDDCKELRAQLAASQERERVAREVLEDIATGNNECLSRGDFAERARDTLARIDAMKETETT